MKNFKTLSIFLSFLMILILSGVYLCLMFILPYFLNSANTIIKIQNFVKNKFQTTIIIDNLKFTSNPKLFLDIKTDKITVKGIEDKDVIILKNLSATAKLNGIKNLKADYLYFNSNNLKKNTEKEQKMPLSKIPSMHISTGKIILGSAFEIDIENLNILKIPAGKSLDFKGKIASKKKFAIFEQYKGNISGKLEIKENKFLGIQIFGKIIANDINGIANAAFLTNAPVHINNEEFHFNGADIQSEGIGTLGGQKVYHNFKIKNFLSKTRETKGNIYSNLAPGIVKYIPNFQIQNSAGIKIDYTVTNKKNFINYTINLKKGADIFYKHAYVGLREKDRKLYIETLKDKNKLYIKNFNYSTIENSINSLILYGDALFEKNNSSYQPRYLTIKTNGWAPASTTGSFNRFIAGGIFKGNLSYDFVQNIMLGDFTIKDFIHKDFYVETAVIKADKNLIDITAEGKYRREKFTSKLQAKNNLNEINKRVHIYNMELFLDKYKFRKRYKKNHKEYRSANKYKQIKVFAAKVRDIDILVDNWKVTANSIIYNKIVLKDVNLVGSLKDDIFKFSTSKVAFANGILSANGQYDFKHKNSDIVFSAKNVDSNIAAALLFNLPGQVEGTADGTLNIITHNKLDDIQAYVTFKINDGFLPKIGSKEFLSKHNNKKFKISDIINIKARGKKNLSSDITGSFYMDNHILKDINLTSKQRYLSFLIEGNYDIINGEADLMLFGKYSSVAQKGIKIFFIPISFIMKFLFKPENTLKNYKTKLEKIPSIDAKAIETNYFRVKLYGNLIQNKINVEMKSIIE